MSWAVGDLALCVASGWRLVENDQLDTGFRPRSGGIYNVSSLVVVGGRTFLAFDGSGSNAFIHEAFRKIEPLTDWEHGQFEIELMVDARRQKERAL
ncbi:hypothetical protein [Novosphingobium gossypii]|uniref:hypothetical protein n=1 Tax=Novosphingobium gossypii TaxID=1604774 RepID=UPI003D22340C